MTQSEIDLSLALAQSHDDGSPMFSNAELLALVFALGELHPNDDVVSDNARRLFRKHGRSDVTPTNPLIQAVRVFAREHRGEVVSERIGDAARELFGTRATPLQPPAGPGNLLAIRSSKGGAHG